MRRRFPACILSLFDEFGNVILADGTIRDRIALDHRNFNVVIAGKEQAFPLFFRAFFEGQFEVGVLGANELRKLVKRKETLRLLTGLACSSPWFSASAFSVFNVRGHIERGFLPSRDSSDTQPGGGKMRK